MVSGELASGKTALLEEFAETVLGSPGLLLTATATGLERSLHMGLLAQLFHSDRLPAGVAEAAAGLIDAEMSRARSRGTDSAGAVDAAVAQGLCGLLLELARTAPLVITIDDVQHADCASLAVLLRLRRRIRSSPIVLVVTEWTQPGEIPSAAHAAVGRRPDQRIVVGPLSMDGVGTLLAARIGAAGAKRLAPALYALTGGNPLLANALADDCLEHRLNGTKQGEGESVVGPAYRRAVLECLYRWDGRLLEISQGIAVLGDAATLMTLGRLLDSTPGTVRQLLDVLEMAGLTVGSGFRHPELAAAALESACAATRTELHVRAAEIIYETGGQPLEIARHIVNSGVIPGPWAIESLHQAAAEAVSAEELEIGVKGLELALRECGESDGLMARTPPAGSPAQPGPESVPFSPDTPLFAPLGEYPNDEFV